MRLGDFDFELPGSLIAGRPAVPRDASRLLIVDPRAAFEIREARVCDLAQFLGAGDVLVVNDTKVLKARLSGVRVARIQNGLNAHISLTCIEPMSGGRWRALARPARRLRARDRIVIGDGPDASIVEIYSSGEGGEVIAGPLAGHTLEEIMAARGALPLPPYMQRNADVRDETDYQTVFAATAGAVAAPTAGLHFTEGLLAGLQTTGVRIVRVTLHVGAGTFLPVKCDRIEDHTMHAERCELSEAAARTINAAKTSGKRVIAVGTTVMRVLEAAARLDGEIEPFSGQTGIFIKPGHRFRAADLLMTNFHLPKSTLFMLVCAFSGTATMKRAYAHAIAAGFRFYSYGDACLLYPASGAAAR